SAAAIALIGPPRPEHHRPVGIAWLTHQNDCIFELSFVLGEVVLGLCFHDYDFAFNSSFGPGRLSIGGEEEGSASVGFDDACISCAPFPAGGDLPRFEVHVA